MRNRGEELGNERILPLTFASVDAAVAFMRDLKPAAGCTYTMMIPDGHDCRGFVNWKSIIKRGPDEVRD